MNGTSSGLVPFSVTVTRPGSTRLRIAMGRAVNSILTVTQGDDRAGAGAAAVAQSMWPRRRPLAAPRPCR